VTDPTPDDIEQGMDQGDRPDDPVIDPEPPEGVE
jgi:hypothetical protein